mgnify:CR=1 FL=1
MHLHLHLHLHLHHILSIGLSLSKIEPLGTVLEPVPPEPSNHCPLPSSKIVDVSSALLPFVIVAVSLNVSAPL